jgi:muramoyltetrapeptide carboxypeptidase LdcA involved in peptidoglycan recycling
VFVGYSDVMNLHILCYKNGLSTFYGDNLLYPIAEAQGWHHYSKKWFMDVFFTNKIIGMIPPAKEWTYESTNYTNPQYTRQYYKNTPYKLLQGTGIVQGSLFGGHLGLMELMKKSKMKLFDLSAINTGDLIFLFIPIGK